MNDKERIIKRAWYAETECESNLNCQRRILWRDRFFFGSENVENDQFGEFFDMFNLSADA